MSPVKKIISLWGPVLIFAVLVFLLSSLSDPIEKPPFRFFDKVAHTLEYAIFATLLYRALNGTLKGRDFFWVALLTVVITIGYGMSDEFHQAFVPARRSEVKDLAADGFGALLAMTAVYIKRKVFDE